MQPVSVSLAILMTVQLATRHYTFWNETLLKEQPIPLYESIRFNMLMSSTSILARRHAFFAQAFPSAVFVNHVLPTEYASDLYLLAAYAYGSFTSILHLPRDSLAAFRDRCVQYCQLLETIVVAGDTKILETSTDPQS